MFWSSCRLCIQRFERFIAAVNVRNQLEYTLVRMRLPALAALICIGASPSVAQERWWPDRMVGLSQYPPLARQARIEGVVELLCLLDENGSVLKVTSISGHPLLLATASENAIKWHFRRVLRRGAVDRETTLVYQFQIAGEPVRSPPKTEFVFEGPNKILLTTEPACPDHAPCTPEGKKHWERRSTKRSKELPFAYP